MEPKKNQQLRSYEVLQAMATLVVILGIVLIAFLLWFDLFFIALFVFIVTVWTIRVLKQRADFLRKNELRLEVAKEQLALQIGRMFEDIQKFNQNEMQYVSPVGKLGDKTIYQWIYWSGFWFEYEGLIPDGMVMPMIVDPANAKVIAVNGCIYSKSEPDMKIKKQLAHLKDELKAIDIEKSGETLNLQDSNTTPLSLDEELSKEKTK